MKAVIALVVALSALASAKPRGETQMFPGRIPGKIVGGVEADRHEFKFIADMRRGSHYCAGSVISESWVVTAAHCSQGLPSAYTLTAGDHNINTVDGTEQTRQVVQIINHPNYGSPAQYENDIALMKVEPPFEFNEFVQPVVLPARGFEPTPIATVTGWGALTEGGSSPSNLYKVDVPYVNDAQCRASYGQSAIADSMICYGEAGKDSCQGDSGGPIVCGVNQTLCGIVSWGQGCARPNYPGVYTETSYYDEWIRTTIIPTAEDPSPVVTVTSCGGLIANSSAAINFKLNEDVAAGQKCVWTVKAPFDSLRLRLVSSGLGSDDHIFVTKYDSSTGGPGVQTEIDTVGANVTSSGGMAFITLSVGADSTSQGFSLEFFSSGFGDATPALSGYADLTDSVGLYKYPESGQYRNNEQAVFVLSPAEPGDRTLKFSEVNVENDSSCRYDAVAVFTFNNNMYSEVARFCGNTNPPSINLPGGLALITFTTDSSVVGNGFTFGWA